MESTDTKNWYDNYIGFKYLHLGDDPETGIDCFNLCRLVYKKELNINIPLSTSDFCDIVDEDWYSKINTSLFENGVKIVREDFAWKSVTDPEPFDIILMSIGTTNVTNHCALYVGGNKILQTMIDKTSWAAPYGKYYKQYTTGIHRWTIRN